MLMVIAGAATGITAGITARSAVLLTTATAVAAIGSAIVSFLYGRKEARIFADADDPFMIEISELKADGTRVIIRAYGIESARQVVERIGEQEADTETETA